jgi:hypothetical protein
VSALGVVSDFVIGLVAEPVWQGSVLFLLFGKALLHQQGLVGTHLWLEILLLNIFIPQSYPSTQKSIQSAPSNLKK